ncbi:MAG: type II toxin-antitoxin system PemK/MazF family toxin [Gammaproteobacteria bacterium]
MIYDPFDVVVVPFPFTDRTAAKRRPALVLSQKVIFGAVIEHSVMATITSAANPAWPLDVSITDGSSAGLAAASVVRMKLFTLDNQLILRKCGSLSVADQRSVAATLRKLLGA